MKKKEAFEILGVPANASKDEIKQAYRRLAQKYHPDKNQGDAEAEEKFKQVKAAFEHLESGKPDPETFGRFDPDSTGIHEFMRRMHEQMNIVQNATFTVSLEDAFKGCQKDIEVADTAETVRIIPGMVPGSRLTTIEKKINERQHVLNIILQIDTGEYDVNWAMVPNLRGGGTQGSGDMLRAFRINWVDLALGGSAKIKCIDGDEVTFWIPAGQKAGSRIRIKERGYWKDMQKSGRGDLYLEVVPDVPKLEDMKVTDVTRFVNAVKDRNKEPEVAEKDV